MTFWQGADLIGWVAIAVFSTWLIYLGLRRPARQRFTGYEIVQLPIRFATGHLPSGGKDAVLIEFPDEKRVVLRAVPRSTKDGT